VHHDEFVARPARGRVHELGEVKVRLGDVTASGRLRLDAVARWLQDVATDDVDDAYAAIGEPNPTTWVIRWLVLDVGVLPRYGERCSLATWSNGLGPRWAGRRTDLVVDDVARVRSDSAWVHVDRASGRPTPLPSRIIEDYSETAGGRPVAQRLRLPGPAAYATTTRPWPLRATDCDVLGHVNNAAYLGALEELLAPRAAGAARRHIVRVAIEWRGGIDPGDVVELASVDGGPELRAWLLVAGEVRAAMVAAFRR
jgi:acyl-ACP thioesterase